MADITIKDIARMCGVGVSTVSRALNNQSDINPGTRARILEVVRETGFVPNTTARLLKQSETNNVAFLVKGITNPVFAGMLQVMEAQAEEKGYAVILRRVGPTEDEVLVALHLIRERKLRGIVFLGGNFTHEESELGLLGVPFVFATIGEDPEEKAASKGHHDNGKVGYVNIAVDDVKASYDAVQYLIGLGHARIGMITEGLGMPSVGQLRYRGYCRALRDAGIVHQDQDVVVVTKGIEHFSLSNGYEAAQELMKKSPELTAIFCVSDILAIGACRAILDAGKRIPEDVSVMGFDGIGMGSYVNPRLTTMQQPFEEIAASAMKSLFGMLEDGAMPCDDIMEAQLVERESTGRCRVQR